MDGSSFFREIKETLPMDAAAWYPSEEEREEKRRRKIREGREMIVREEEICYQFILLTTTVIITQHHTTIRIDTSIHEPDRKAAITSAACGAGTTANNPPAVCMI